MPSLLGSSARNVNKHYTIAPDDRVPGRQKVAYGLGTFIDMWGHWLYPNIALQVFVFHMGIAPTLVGIALFLNRAFDAFSDPLFGWLSDNARTRIGRRRPFMYVGSVLAGIGLPFLVAVAAGWGNTFGVSNYFWFMLISSAVYLPMVSCFNMPYQSLGNEMTPDYHERTSLFSYKNAIQKLPEAGLFFAGLFFTRSAWIDATPDNALSRLKSLFTSLDAWKDAPDGVQPNILLGSQVFLAIGGVIIIMAGLVCTAIVRERYYDRLIATNTEKLPFLETIGKTFACHPFRIQLVIQVAYQMGLSMVNALGATLTVFYVSAGNQSEGNTYNFKMGLAYMIVGLLGVPVFASISRKLGKRQGMVCVFVTGILVFASTWWLYTPQVKWLQILASGLISFCSAGFWMLIASIGADVIDYDELQTGKRREGAFASCGSWIMKVGMALGALISTSVLDWVGFDKNLGGNQSPGTMLTIRILLAAVPIAGLLAGLFALARFPLTQAKVMDIRTQLEARRGKV
ncbi:MAG: MFS transporter [Opitutaceae bacterium]|nr:MFS transporter [Opitutaceae bacterium]